MPDVTNEMLIKIGADTRGEKVILDAYGNIARVVKSTATRHKTDTELMRASINRMAKALKDQTSALVEVATQTAENSKRANDYSDRSEKMRLVTGGVQKALGVLRNQLLLVAFAYQTVKRFIQPALDAYIDQERALTRLHFIMVEQGTETELAFRRNVKLAESLQSLTGFEDDQIENVMATLEATRGLSDEYKERAIPLILDLARFTELTTGEQVDLERTTKAVSRALKGSTDSLIEMGVNLGKVKRGTMGANDVLTLLEERVGGAAQKFQDFRSEASKLKAQWDDVQEGFGENFAKAIKPVMDYLTSLTEVMKLTADREKLVAEERKRGTGELKQLPPLYDRIIGRLAQWRREHLSIKALFEGNTEANRNYAESLKETNAETEKNIQLLMQQEDGLQKQKTALEEFLEAHKERVREVFEAMKIGEEVAKNVAVAMKDAFADLFYDAIMEKHKSWQDRMLDTWEMFSKAVIKMVAEIAAKMLILSLWPQAAPFLGVQVPIKAHSGGIIPSFQRGGEVPALLEAGEGVVTRRGMAMIGPEGLSAINNGQFGGGGRVVNVWNIDTIDAKSFREYLAQNSDMFVASVYGDLDGNYGLRKRMRSGI